MCSRILAHPAAIVTLDDLRPDLRAERVVADADGHSAGAVREDQRAVRLLELKAPGSGLLALAKAWSLESIAGL